ncbi:hypothetical protein BCR43DRAFT_489006, partial [Syncephalastrum racemosum]
MSTLSQCPPLTPPHSPHSWSAGRKRRLPTENDSTTIPFAHPVDFSGKKRRFSPSPPPPPSCSSSSSTSFATESTFPTFSHSTQNHTSLYDPSHSDDFSMRSSTQTHTVHEVSESGPAAPSCSGDDPDYSNLYVTSEDWDMDGIETYRVLRRDPDGGLLVESQTNGGLPMELRPGEHKMRIPDFVLQKRHLNPKQLYDEPGKDRQLVLYQPSVLEKLRQASRVEENEDDTRMDIQDIAETTTYPELTTDAMEL